MKTRTKRVYTGFSLLLIFLLIFAAIFYRDFRTVVVNGDSMLPTYKNGEKVLVSKAYWLVGAIQKKDVVLLRGTKAGEFLIKRVYKMQGEEVDFNHIPDEHSIAKGRYFVPEGTIYVLGDNAIISEDSRRFGPVDLVDVLGKVVLRR